MSTGPRMVRRAELAAIALGASLAAGCSFRMGVDATATTPADINHAWVTVTAVWLATGADTPPDASSSWTQLPLSTPVTLDLAAMSPGALTEVLKSTSVPPGTYHQVHLVLADPSDALTSSAGNNGLTYNSQIEVTRSNGSSTTAPLEYPTPGSGITIPTTLHFTGSSALLSSSSSSSSSSTSSSSSSASATLAVTVDAARDVVTYAYGANTGYLLSPITRVAEEKSVGAISGSVDTSQLAAGHAPVYASAETTDSSGTHYVVARRVLVASDGSFTVYPLPVSGSGTSYDLVLSCAGANPVIIQGVPVSTGSSATVVQSTPIVLTTASTVYVNVASQTPALPGGARVTFYETPPTDGAVPYAIDSTAVDPVTRRLPGGSFALPSGALVIGTYAANGTITFATVTAAEGTGGYLVGTEGLYRADTLTSKAATVTGSQGSPSSVTAPYPNLPKRAIEGTLTVALSSTPGRYDSGFVTVSAGGRIVETADISAALQSGVGQINITNLPAGSTLASSNGPAYQIGVRAWNSANAAGTITQAAGRTSFNLGDSGQASVSIQVL